MDFTLVHLLILFLNSNSMRRISNINLAIIEDFLLMLDRILLFFHFGKNLNHIHVEKLLVFVIVPTSHFLIMIRSLSQVSIENQLVMRFTAMLVIHPDRICCKRTVCQSNQRPDGILDKFIEGSENV